ncbi:GTPase [Actinomadura mexicana]|uniref:50S ribosome-binding GTPase n=1 Tax=Actinomadura mexicana TaxID=134959 RepID=A0A239B109_9ACTN|nr:GTPase [Actinomadura mexicana]SNS00903.1 50S ribosome-binding GTPase [Actinomadura mexicana]
MTAGDGASALIARHCSELLAAPAFRDDPALRDDPTLRDVVAQCGQPLRVLLVGSISTGKSTLLNALVGRPLAATAFAETTSTVTWYHAPDLPAPDLPDPGHRSVACDFPLARHVLLGDTPGLDSVVHSPRETLRMLGGSDLTGAAAAFVCVLTGGRIDQWARGIEELAAFSAGPLDVVGNIVVAMSKIDLVSDPVEEIEEKVRRTTPVPFRFAAVNQLMAATARTGGVDARVLGALEALRERPDVLARPTLSWERLAEQLSDALPPGHLDALRRAVGGPAWLPALVRASAGRTSAAEVAEVFEELSRIRSLEAVLADIAGDRDLFTATAANLRLHRLAARLPDGPAALLRARLDAVAGSREFALLSRRAGGRLIERSGVDGLDAREARLAVSLLRSEAVGRADASAALARWREHAADPFRDSRFRELAALVVDAAREALSDPRSDALMNKEAG